MGKKKFLKKGVAYLLSAAMVLTGPWYTGGGIKADAAQPADITSGLIAYYTFNGNLDNIVSTTGGKASLHGGASNNDGHNWWDPPAGNAAYGEGKKGKAYSFTGDTTSRGEGLELDVKTGESFTISAWVNTEEKIDYQPIFFTNVDGENYVTAGTMYNNFASGGIVNYKSKWYWLDKNNHPASSLNDLPLNTWTHIVLTFDGSGKAVLYYNAEVLSWQKIDDYTAGTYKDMPIFLGVNWWNSSFKGLMDDVAIYNRALSADDVAALYAEESADPSTQTLSITAAGDKTTLTNKKDSAGNYTLDSVQLSALEFPKKPTWKVNDSAHAIVDENGKVTLTEGATDGEKITVTAENIHGVTGTIDLTVKVEEIQTVSIESVALNKQTASMEEGDTLSLTATVLPENATDKSVTWASDNPSVAAVDQDGKVTAVSAGTATITAASKENAAKSASCKVTVTEESSINISGPIADESQLSKYRSDLAYKRVGVHDPSIVQDPKTKRYYLFGSHCAWAWSDDLENWTSFENNILDADTDKRQATAPEIFKDEIAWCKRANANYTVAGNLWAPDVIWDADYKNADGTTGAWLMYMSINGPDWNSTISLLTSDRLDGNWTYVGPVIQSGMSNGYGPTFDYQKVTGGTDVTRFTSAVSVDSKGNKTPTLEAHAIDPCVLYDDDGNLWMTYGSWSGGISMIKLDTTTGLRDYSTTYADTNNIVGKDGFIADPYTGYKIAGGGTVSGEGSYIQKIGDYYYMFLSYGGYAPEGGYNMRVFRSSDIKGPYKDAANQDARQVITGNQTGNVTGTVGMRLMSYYKWNFADYGYTAQGHNSATVDEESGKAFVIYHNKYNDGTAAHEVRVHQLLTNEDGWILAAPFEYAGETVKDSGYTQNAIAGDYGIMFQKQKVDGIKCTAEQSITLEAGTGDASTGYTGNITGDVTGTWTTKANSPYVSLTIGGTTYKGVLCDGIFDETNVKTMTFTAVGSNQECLWGYKIKDPTVAIRMTMDKIIYIPDIVVTDIPLPTTGVGGSKITWKSNSVAIADDGSVPHLFDEDSKVSMTATISNGGCEYSKVYEFTVLGNTNLSEDSDVVIRKFYTDTELDMSALKQGSCPKLANPFYYTHEDLSKGVSISFDVVRTAASDRLSNIISFNNKLGRLFFTGGSYLGYNDFNGRYMDANLNSGYVAGTDYLKDNTKVTIKIEITSKGFTVYQNGTAVYTSAEVKSKAVPGGFSADNPETTMLAWIQKVPELNIGSGNFWNDLIFKGKISNIVCSYRQPEMDVNSGGSSSLSGLYTQDFEKVTDISTEWDSTTAKASLSLGNAGDEHGKYMEFSPGGQNSRGAHSYFGDNVTWPDNYILEYDVVLQAGNNQESQFAVLTNKVKYTSGTENDGVDEGYVVKLTATNSETWTVVNGKSSNSKNTVDIPKSAWVHVMVSGEKDSKDAKLKITNGDKTLFDGDVTATDTGTVKGLYMRAGRYNAICKIDNIVVIDKDNPVDRTAYDNLLARAELYAAVQAENPIYSAESIQKLEDAIVAAKDAIKNDSAQAVFDEQAAALKAAIEGLERVFYIVTVEAAENGTVTGLAAGGKYFAGDSMSLTAVPDEGYILESWKVGGTVVGENTEYSAKVIENMTITPTFKEGSYAPPTPDDGDDTPGASSAPGGPGAPGASASPGASAAPGASDSPAPKPTSSSGSSNTPGGSSGGSSSLWTPSASPTPSPSATPEPTPGASAKPDTPDTSAAPVVTPKPSASAKPQVTPAPSKNKVEKNKVYTAGSNKYKVTSATSKKKTVTLLRVTANKSVKNLKVGATVKIKGQTFKITKIDKKAFVNCKKLESVVVGKNITTLGAKCFAGCTNLKKVTFKTKVLKKVGKDAFKKINKNAVLKVPKAKLTKYKKLLKKKVQPSTVKITK